jgi:hypothetical protein
MRISLGSIESHHRRSGIMSRADDPELPHDLPKTEVAGDEDLPKPPTSVTGSAQAFLTSFFQTFGLFHRTIDLALRADYVAHVADAALKEKKRKADTPTELAQKAPGPVILQLRKDSQALIEMVLSRLVDHFTTYLSEVLREALSARPEMLRSQEQVRVDYVLQFAAMEDLREDMVDRKVLELSFLGFADLESWCLSRMGIQLAPDPTMRAGLVELIETRNLIVHNRARVGSKYLRMVPNSRFRLGDLRALDVEAFIAAFKLLLELVKHVDGVIASKFGLLLIDYGPPPRGDAA